MNKNSNALLGLVILLTIIVVVLAYVLFTTPAPGEGTPNGEAQNGQTSTPTSTPSQSLEERVIVYQSASGLSPDGTFVIAGEAPGPWYFEASFPIDVLDEDGNLLTTAVAQAQDEWMTTEQVPFEANADIGSYRGPATLVLKRDNPSGLPENDASVEVAIVIE